MYNQLLEFFQAMSMSTQSIICKTHVSPISARKVIKVVFNH